MSMHVRKGLLFGLLLTLAPVAAAVAQTGAITGRVTSAATNEPLASAQVEAVGATGAVAARATTNQDGRFRLTPLRPPAPPGILNEIEVSAAAVKGNRSTVKVDVRNANVSGVTIVMRPE